MPFQRPTLSQLVQQARANFAARLPGADAAMPRSNIGVAAIVLAGLVNGCYGFLDWCASQILPNQKQDPYFTAKWGALFGLAPNPAISASGHALFTGVSGTTVPDNTKLTDSAGEEYKTSGDVVLGSGSTSIPVTALSGGAGGNLLAGAILTLETAIAGVDATATVDSDGFAGGLDAETNDAFRARVAARMQTPPGGSGTKSDYEAWAKAAFAGVTRAEAVGTPSGPGTVDVYFVCDGRADPIPTAGDRSTVLAYINARQPLTDIPGTSVKSPTANPIAFQLSSSAVPSALRDAVASVIADLLLGLDIGDGLSIQGQLIPAIAAIGNAIGGNFLVAPTSDIAADVSKVLTVGSITYV